MGVEEFAELVGCLDAARRTLLGEVATGRGAGEAAKVFASAASPMPDGELRLTFSNFCDAVHSNAAFLRLFGLAPRQLAADTSAGAQYTGSSKTVASCQSAAAALG